MIPKYRVWHKTNKKMYVVRKLLFDKEGELCSVYLHASREPFGGYSPKRKNMILMQSTGKFDKNKEEIYAGDFFKEGDTIMLINDLHWFCWRIWEYSIETEKQLEIIGNIHENPELKNRVER